MRAERWFDSSTQYQFNMKYLFIVTLLITGCATKINQKTLILPNSQKVIKQDHYKVYKLMKIYGVKDLTND